MLNFKINSNEIDNIGNFNAKEKEFRLKNLDSFNKNGFPNKKSEDWKFSDLREIVSKNFKKLDLKLVKTEVQKINLKKKIKLKFKVIQITALQTSKKKTL